MTVVLGINSFFEHPSAVLLRDDQVLYAVEDERFTGIKHGKKYTPYRTYVPVDSIFHALRDTGLEAGDIDEIAVSYSRWTHLRSLWGCFAGRRFDSFAEELSAFLSASHLRPAMRSGWEIPQKYQQIMVPKTLGSVRYREWPHHLSHAASAFYCSGFDQALTVVADGAGEHAGTSVYFGRDRELRRIGGAELPHSLGLVYSMTTRHLGFEPFSDEFKVMGLAAYGEDRFEEPFGRLVRLGPKGTYQVDARLLRDLPSVLGPARKPDEQITQRHRDVATSLQRRLENALLHVVGHHLETTGATRLCLAGGIFLNCVANGRLARLAGLDDVFVQPAAHDAGTALGAAALSMVARGGPTQLAFESAALGSEHDDSSVRRAITAAGFPVERLTDEELIPQLVSALAAGQVVGVFRGRMEFGPRALGQRSLLADPRPPDMRNRLNRLKGREDFRPVAPVVAAEHFDDYFDGQRNRYMLFTTRVRDEVRDLVPSVVHADGTARVQTVGPDDDPWLHRLLNAFGSATGVPMLINTSLNVRGRPIVESPEEAIACLFTTEMDMLVLGHHVLRR